MLLTAAILACNPGGIGVDAPGFLPSKADKEFLGTEGANLFAKGVGPGLWWIDPSGGGFGLESDIWEVGGVAEAQYVTTS